MANKVTISLEKDRVKVLYATRRGRRYLVKDILTFSYPELDRFLREEKSSKFFVCASFNEFFQDTLYLPPARKSHLKKLIESEISRSAGFNDRFVFTYFNLGKRTIEGKIKQEVFVFAVPLQEVESYLTIFNRYNKKIKCFLPDFLTLLNIIPVTEYPVLYIYPRNNERLMFVVQDGKLIFYRSFSAISEILDNIDIQNINMTVTYCKQRLNISPEFAVLIGDPDVSDSLNMDPLVPLASLTPPANIDLKGLKSLQRISEYILPLSLLQKWKKEDFLPKNYHYKWYLKYYLNTASTAFAVTGLVFALLSGLKIKQLSTIKKDVTSLRQSLLVADPIIRQVRSIKNEYNRYRTLEDILSKKRKGANPVSILIQIPEVVSKDIQIKSIMLQRTQDGQKVAFTIAGKVKGEGFFEVEANIKGLSAGLKNIEGLQILGIDYNLSNREFQISGNY